MQSDSLVPDSRKITEFHCTAPWVCFVVAVHGQGERGTAIWRVSPPHNVADLSEFVMANSFAATLRGEGHLTPRERLRFVYFVVSSVCIP